MTDEKKPPEGADVINLHEGVAMADWNYAEWAEKNGRENLRGRLATGDFLLQQANTLLTLMLVAVTGLLAWGVRIFGAGAGPVEWGCAVAAVWLCAVVVTLTVGCIATKETQALFNEPGNIYRPHLGLSQTEVLASEMVALQGQIDKTKVRNAAVATWLDRCRYAAVVTPLVFAIAAFAAGR